MTLIPPANVASTTVSKSPMAKAASRPLGAMTKHIPNALTTLRLVLAALFFTLLSFYQYEGRGSPYLIGVAFVVYSVALATDYLDGYLARLWKVEGAFGRVVDPFVDKVLVLGSFIFFAGKNFIIPDGALTAGIGPQFVAKTITGINPTIVVLLLARELLVTTLRGAVEAGGVSFGAAWAGKVKMVVQSVTILVILAYVCAYPWLKGHELEVPATLFRSACIWVAVAVTLYSAWGYVRRSAVLLRRGGGEDSDEGIT
jgi:CDP-diacylglycerol---glycerol-3-phosphate 3-phosphatidyltransferase